jgi:hypothetical protein
MIYDILSQNKEGEAFGRPNASPLRIIEYGGEK